MASLEQSLGDCAIVLNEVELGVDIFARLLLFQRLLLLEVGTYNGIEVTVGLGSPGDGCRRGAGELVGSLLYRLWDGFCALDVSLTLLQVASSELANVPMHRMVVGLRWAV